MTTISRLITQSLLLISLSLIAFNSMALGQLGHQVVCQLGFEQLPISQQEQINQLLKSMPKSHQKRLNKYTNSPQNDVITFAKSCVWADAIKKHDDYKQFEKWHYLNVSRHTQKITTNACQQNCIAQAVIIHQQQLATANNPWRKLQALMFLGHWLGDIHQPLHISYASDWGGNKIKISAKSNVRCKTLHWYWDDCVLSRQNRSFTQWVTLLTNVKKQKVSVWNPEDVWHWADESYQVVTSEDFKYCIKDNGKCRSPRGNKITLPEGYQAQFAPIINQRMVLAGKRLSDVLQQSL